jgi:hypothetical protein
MMSSDVKTLLERAKKYHFEKAGYDGRHEEYIYCSPFCPSEQIPVGAVLEPVVPASEWNLDDNAKLTINHYNSLILNSKNLLILDVDFADRRYNKWAVANIHQLIGYMHDLGALDAWRYQDNHDDLFAGMEEKYLWSEQTWEISTTRNGARVICKSMPFPLDGWSERAQFLALCRFLGADPIYTQKCVEQRCYRARLTPKYSGDTNPVCMSLHKTLWVEREPHPELKAQLDMHHQVSSYQPPMKAVAQDAMPAQ